MCLYYMYIMYIINVILPGETNKGVGKAGQGRGRSKARVRIWARTHRKWLQPGPWGDKWSVRHTSRFIPAWGMEAWLFSATYFPPLLRTVPKFGDGEYTLPGTYGALCLGTKVSSSLRTIWRIKVTSVSNLEITNIKFRREVHRNNELIWENLGGAMKLWREAFG